MDVLWTESLRPKSLQSLSFHTALTGQLNQLAQNHDFPHLLFYGPNGAGKKTRIMAFLKEIYGNGVYNLQSEDKEYKVNDTSSTVASCTVVSSKFHIDVTPSDAENNDKTIVNKLIKEVASSHQINSKQLKEFKVVVINEADNLSREAQASLRRTMEKYVEKCRLILTCESLGKIIHPIRSRCLLIRVSSPTDQEIQHVLMEISSSLKLGLSADLALDIAVETRGNLRQAILILQSFKIDKKNLNQSIKVPQQQWKSYIQENIVKRILDQQTTEKLKEIREFFYCLLINCIAPEKIIIEILEGLLQKSKDQRLYYKLIEVTAHAEHKMKQGQKSIFHLEALTAQYMSLIYDSLRQ